jgi:putative DNA primase/helicase
LSVADSKEIYRRLVEALGAKRSGAGYIALCVAHDDRDPSLSLSLGDDGKILIRCHAGCPQGAVIDALRKRDLWPSRSKAKSDKSPPRFVRAYQYTDEFGHLLYRVARFEPKDFRPQHLSASGAWLNGYGGSRRVLYNLPEVIANDKILILEGEKDVERCRDYGFVGTTNAGGANGWREEFNPFFRDKQVFIIPDADAPGMKRAVQIARGILPFARSVNILELNDGKDISEWFERGHSEVELAALLEQDNGSD